MNDHDLSTEPWLNPSQWETSTGYNPQQIADVWVTLKAADGGAEAQEFVADGCTVCIRVAAICARLMCEICAQLSHPLLAHCLFTHSFLPLYGAS